MFEVWLMLCCLKGSSISGVAGDAGEEAYSRM